MSPRQTEAATGASAAKPGGAGGAAGSRRIEVFRPGTFTPMQGEPVTMTAADLKAIAAAYDAEANPAPVVVGHPATDAPAYGWASAFTYDEASQRLVADCGYLAPEFEEAVAAKRYRRISLALFSPTAPNNPKPGAWYPKHVGFLGGAAPAVSNLKPVHFAEGDAGVVTVEFGDPALREVASVLSKLRDWFVERDGVEAAERVVPGWSVRWIESEADDRPDPTRRDPMDGPRPAFAAPAEPAAAGDPEPEPPVTTTAKPAPNDAAFAEREAQLAAREAKAADRDRELAHADNLAFAEALVAEGRLLPVSRDKVVAVLDGLSPGSAQLEVSFAEGDGTATRSALVALREVLKAQPKVVDFSETPRAQADAAGVAFAAPDGKAVDAAGLALLGRAEAYRRANPTVSFQDALAAVAAKT